MRYRHYLIGLALVLGIPALLWAADVMISARPSVSTLDGSEVIGVIQGGVDKKMTLTDVWSGLSAWPTFSTTKSITWADSDSNKLCIGDDASRAMCFYGDSTDGAVIRPATLGDTIIRAWTNFNLIFYDVEGAKNFAVIDPDAIGAGSGTFTMQTSEQFVASNLGVELAESDTNPTCGAGNYNIYADTSEAKIKKCVNGTASDIDINPKGPFLVRKTADVAIQSDASVNNDADLLFAVDANSVYRFDAFIMYSSDTTADFQIDWTVPAGATGHRYDEHMNSTATDCSALNGGTDSFNSVAITVLNNSIGGESTSAVCVVHSQGMVVTAGTAGNVQFQWAQANSTATDTTVRANSYIAYQKF